MTFVEKIRTWNVDVIDTTYVQVKDNKKSVTQCREAMKKPFRQNFFVSVYFSYNLSLFVQKISIFALMDKKGTITAKSHW
jgi:hypothetical protein